MTEDIQEIERPVKQSADLGDSLIRLAQKLQEQSRHQAQNYEERSENLRALHKTLTDLRSYIDVVKREIGPHRLVRKHNPRETLRTNLRSIKLQRLPIDGYTY
jgi:hypothetical protein